MRTHPMRTLTTNAAPSKRKSRAALMQTVLRITAAAGPVRGFRPHVVNPGHAQLGVLDAPASRTIH